jgi:hypothetical protein
MKEALLGAIKPVKARQQSVFTIHCIVAGLLVAAVGGLAGGVARLAFDLDLPWAVSAAVLAVGPVVGLLIGLTFRRDDHGAAAAIDGHYGLKDRTVTALAFASQGAADDLKELQYTDAMTHLQTVEPKAVVPLTAPRTWPYAVIGTAAALTLLLWPLSPREAEAGPATTPGHVQEMADARKAAWEERKKELTEMIHDTDDATPEEKQALNELIKKNDKLAEQMAQEPTSENEALAKLSEMMANNRAMADILNIAALDGQLGALGTTLAATQAFEGAGKALQKGDLDKAAKELDKIQEVSLTPKEAKDLEQKLREQQKKAGDAGQGSLGEAIGEFADAVKGGGKANVGNAAKNLAKKVNSAIRKRRAANLLDAEDADANEAKGNLGMNGGARTKNPQKSMNPSSDWGRGISGNEGERTKLNSKRNEVQVTGTPGDEGESDTETTTTPEARQRASKEYQEKFQKGKKESQAVLESEPIPLGHRQTVRKYFEMIRPSTADAFEKKDEPKPEKK